MQTKIREIALELGFIDAQPVTGHPFEVWRERLMSSEFGKYLKLEHDPAKASGWPLEEITIWAAIAPTPPMTDWPEGRGEIGAHYMGLEPQKKRRTAWEDAVAALGYEIVRGVNLPERAAAIRARLGVHGLNGLMIAPDYGSFINITVLLVRAAPPDNARGPEYDSSPGCGNCGECITACPTGAITEENGVDVMKCLRNYMNWPQYMPEEYYEKMGRRIIGCDTCQYACPKNAELKCEQPSAEIIDCMKLENLLTEPDFERISKYVNLKGWYNVKTQAVLAAANTGRKDLLPVIEALIGGEDKTLDKMAKWAVERLSLVL